MPLFHQQPHTHCSTSILLEFDRGFYLGIAGVIAAAFIIRIVHFILTSIRKIQSDLRDLNDYFQMNKIENQETAEQILNKHYPSSRQEFRENILQAMEEYRHKGKQAEPNW